MTPEEENKLQERLGEATDIRERLNLCNIGIQILNDGIFGLNASTYRKEYETVGRALSLVQDDVIQLLEKHILELEEKYKRL